MMKLSRMFSIVICVIAINIQAQTKIIAHRGYWKCEGSAQNSIASLQKAAEAKLYGSEFDVQLTKDKNVVVNHDDSIHGMRISDVNYYEIKDIKLANSEKISLLDNYLKVGKTFPKLKLILEIKPHRTKEEEDVVTAIVVRMVKDMKMEKQVEYISFSMNICEQLAQLTPRSDIAYLKSDIAPNELKSKGINGIDYNYKAFEVKPEWVAEAHRLGMKVNVWTVNDVELIKKMLDLKVDYITTDYPILTQKISSKKK